MDKDLLRTIGYLNLVLAEHQQRLYDDEIVALRSSLRALQRLVRQ